VTRPKRRIDYHFLGHQWELWQATARHAVLFGGVGSGKTDFGGLWIYKKLKEVESWPRDKAQAIIAANTYDQLIHSTIRNIFGNWRRWGIQFEPSEVPRASAPFTLRVLVNGEWRDCLCRSLNYPDTIRGTEVGFADIDEFVGTTKEAVDIVNSRVRASEQPSNQILYTSTKDDPSHWSHEMFVEKFDAKVMKIVEATSYENPHLPDGFVDSLKATYGTRQFEREVLNKWVALTGGLVYYTFDRSIHVDEAAEHDPALPVIWSHDFNIGEGKPMSSVMCQVKRGYSPAGEARDELHAFDEIVIDTADTNDAIEEWFGRYGDTIPLSAVTICGDASGRSKDTRSKTSDYGLLRDAGFTVQDVPTHNPPIRSRHNLVNGLFKSASGDIRARIHPRCRTLAKGCETVRMKPGASNVELETREQHVTTAWGYLACTKMDSGRRVTSGRRLVGAA